MEFKNEINELENIESKNNYIFKSGTKPILITAPHTMEQIKEDGTTKPSEVYTKAIALYLNKHYGVYTFIKVNDTGVDSNRDNNDEFKKELIKLVNDNNIKLVIDLHGAKKERKFDIELGTLNNLSADYSTIKELVEAFQENGITRIDNNNPFKGGAITQYLYFLENIDVIQLEVNGNYRNINEPDKIYQICKSLGNFIEQYNRYM